MIVIPTGLLYLAARSSAFAGTGGTSKKDLKYALSHAWFMLITLGVVWTGFLEFVCGYEMYYIFSEHARPLRNFEVSTIWFMAVFMAIVLVIQVYIIQMYIKEMIPIYKALKKLRQS